MNRLTRFLLWTLLFSQPLVAAGFFLDATKIIPVALPLSALQFLSVLGAAIVTTRQEGGSVRALLARGFDFRRIRSTGWRAAIFLLMPLAILLSFGMTALSGAAIPERGTPLLALPVFLLVYAISGYCEQIGWTAILSDELLERHSTLASGLILGLVWAAWHVLPFFQTHNPAIWVAWQCLFTVIFRVLLTKVYVLTGRSVFSTIALHATYNAAFSLLPYYGSSYNPLWMAVATGLVTLGVFAWGGQAVSRKKPRG